MKTKMHFRLVALACGLALLGPAGAHAHEMGTATASWAGIDSTTTAGARIVLRRIQAAAAKACGPEPATAMERLQQFRPCVRDAVASAVGKLGNPKVTAAYEGGLSGQRLAQAR